MLLLSCAGGLRQAAPPSLTSASQTRFVNPTLVSLTTESVAAAGSVEALVKERLPTLAQCPAYVARLTGGGLRGEPYLLRDYEVLDDRMEVRLEVLRDEDGTHLEARALSGAASDFDCVEDTIRSWTFAEAEWAALERALPGSLVYRFKAGAEEREAQRQEAAAGLERICAAYAKPVPSAEVTRPYLAMREHVAPRLRLRLDRAAAALEKVPKESSDRLTIFGGVIDELAAPWGLGSRCKPVPGDVLPARAPELNTLGQRFTEDAAGLRTPRFAVPTTFVALTTRAGVSEPELERLVRANLPSLSECIAFSRERADTLEKFEPSGDDLVSVAIDVERVPEIDDRPPSLDLRVGVSPRGWSDGACVAAVVSSWELPQAQLEAMASLPPGPRPAVQFSYRFRPDGEARTRLRRANEKALAPLCEAYRGVGPTSPKPEAVALARLAAAPPVLRQMLRAAAWVVSKLREEGQAAGIPGLWADSWREIELMGGVETPCPAFAAWPTTRAAPAE